MRRKEVNENNKYGYKWFEVKKCKLQIQAKYIFCIFCYVLNNTFCNNLAESESIWYIHDPKSLKFASINTLIASTDASMKYFPHLNVI